MSYNENDTALYFEFDPNDRNNVKITKDEDFINSDAQLSDMAEDVISNLIDASYDVINELIKQYDNSGGFGKVFTAGQIAFIGLTYKTLINLRDERIANGDVGFRDEIVAVGQVIGEGIVSVTAALAGRYIPTNPDSPGKNFIKKAGADIALGIAAGEAYQNLKIPGTDSTSKELVGDFLRGAYDYISKFFFADDSGKTMVTDQSKDDLNNLDSLSNILIIDNETQSIDSYVIKDSIIISDFEQKYNLNSDKLSELINQFTVFQNAENNTSSYLIPNITDQYRQQDYISDIFDIAVLDDYNFNLDLNFSEAFEEFFSRAKWQQVQHFGLSD